MTGAKDIQELQLGMFMQILSVFATFSLPVQSLMYFTLVLIFKQQLQE